MFAAQASNSLSIVSTDSRVWGGWTESGQDVVATTGTSDEMSGEASGVSKSVISAPRGLSAGTAAVSPFQLQLSAYSAPWWEETYGSQLSINASAVTRFSPLSNALQVDLRGSALFNYSPHEQELEFSLRDVTGSTTLLDLRASSDWFPWFEGAQFSCTYLVDPTHEYEFAMSGWINAWDAKDASLSATASIVSLDSSIVPEPSSAALMVLGSTLLLLRRGTVRRASGG